MDFGANGWRWKIKSFTRRIIMNKAHRKTWMKLAVSVAGILFMSGALAIMKINDLRLTNPEDHTTLRVLGLLCTIPLILLVFLDWGWKRVYDERDMHIVRRSQIIGGTATLVFVCSVVFITMMIRPLGSIGFYSLTSWAYLTCFVYWLACSIAALIQYNRGGRDE
jgi:hypothetical protein